MPKKNAFWTFFLEYKRENKIESQQDAMQRADAIWRTMTDAEKKSYSSKKETKSANKPLGPIEVIINNEALFEQKMIEDISSEVTMAKKYNNLSSCRFYIIHVNSFCYHTDLGKHYPCEIGISNFTLKDGVSTDVYHALVCPGPLPSGYSGTARIISEKSHQIPWEYDEEDNTSKVFEEVVNFLMETNKGSSKLPILYAGKKDMNLVQNVFDNWCEYYNQRLNFTVYNVHTLFSLLHKNIITEPWSSESLTFIELEKDSHSFARGLTCEYHESADVQVYCSRSVAIRTGYIICQTCCPGLGIDLIPGQHIPSESKLGLEKEIMTSSKFLDDTNSTVRLDSSDNEDTISSIGRYSMYEEDTASSVDFPRFDNSSVQSDETTIYSSYNNKMSSSGNYDRAARTGSSGFSRRPAVLPSAVNNTLGNIKLSQESTENETFHNRRGRGAAFRGRGGAVSRGRGGVLPRGRGRGHPFQK